MEESSDICCPGKLGQFQGSMRCDVICVRVRAHWFLQLTPFIRGRPIHGRGDYKGDPKGPLSGDRYLNRWKEENGID